MAIDRDALAQLMADLGPKYHIDLTVPAPPDGRHLVAERKTREFRDSSPDWLRAQLQADLEREGRTLNITVPPWLTEHAAAAGRPACVLLAEAIAEVLQQQLEPGTVTVPLGALAERVSAWAARNSYTAAEAVRELVLGALDREGA